MGRTALRREPFKDTRLVRNSPSLHVLHQVQLSSVEQDLIHGIARCPSILVEARDTIDAFRSERLHGLGWCSVALNLLLLGLRSPRLVSTHARAQVEGRAIRVSARLAGHSYQSITDFHCALDPALDVSDSCLTRPRFRRKREALPIPLWLASAFIAGAGLVYDLHVRSTCSDGRPLQLLVLHRYRKHRIHHFQPRQRPQRLS
ncbi:hypothetical protein C8Q74DRAFT_263805 [Fomes fomentarius]|nr:hypothetical protein C8Q74DRAFT_263805 [Fomes fomentarius]